MEEAGVLLCSALGTAAVAGLTHYIRNAAANGSPAERILVRK